MARRPASSSNSATRAARRRRRGGLRAAGRAGRRRGGDPRPRRIPARDRRFEEFADRKARGALRAAGQMRAWGVGIATVEEIDTINIYWARMLAMTRAVEALGLEPAWVLVDGNRLPALAAAVEGDRRGRRQMPLDRRRVDHRQGHPRPDDGRAMRGTASGLWLGDATGAIRRRTIIARCASTGRRPLHRRSFAPVRAIEARRRSRRWSAPKSRRASPPRHTTTG